MFDYERIGYKRVGAPVETKSGMKREKYEKLEHGELKTIVQAEFSENHPMYKRYGVREIQSTRYQHQGNRNVYFNLKADAFGRNIEYEASPDLPFLGNAKKANKKVAEFLQRLKKGIKYKETSFLNNLVEIAKHIK